jgi:hypothetical protein
MPIKALLQRRFVMLHVPAYTSCQCLIAWVVAFRCATTGPHKHCWWESMPGKPCRTPSTLCIATHVQVGLVRHHQLAGMPCARSWQDV